MINLSINPKPVLMAWFMHSLFITGSIPGKAESIRLTWLLGSAPNLVAEPEKSFEFEDTWA